MDPKSVGALVAAGRLDEALAIARQGVERFPGQPAWVHVLGVALYTRGALDEAEAALREAVSIGARDATIHNTFGALQMARGRDEEAAASLGQALAIDPGYAEARFNLATLLRRRGQRDAAIAQLEELLARRPGFEAAHLELAGLYLEAGALAHCARLVAALLQRHPQEPRVLALAAGLSARSGDRKPLHAIIALGDATALERFARAALAAGDAEGAAQAFAEQLRRDPRSRDAPQNLAVALGRLGRRADAKRALADAVAAGHDDPELLAALAYHKASECDWDGLDALVALLRERAVVPGSRPADPQYALYLDGVGAAEQRRWAENWAAARLPRPAPIPGERRERAPGERLRVGFLSPDFYEHATALLIAAFVERHDRTRFEFIAYAQGGDDGSALRERLRAGFDRFVDVTALDSAAAATRIRADRVDVLLDLAGYVGASRMDVLAWRPAPVQGHYLGYPGTTGAPFVDFFVADAVTVPPAHEAHFSERVLRMPGCYQPNDPARGAARTAARAAHGLPADAIVFCSFNQPMKISQRAFAHWCRLLHALPGSLLWLLEYEPAATPNLRAAAAAQGIDPRRLVFAARVPQAQHLARVASADIALDTFPCTSHTTASDVLLAGVPLMTVRGETFASRVAASVLAGAGCGDWAFDDFDAAFEATRALASDRAALAHARARACAARASPLFDATAYVRDFEDLLLRAAGSR